MNKRDSLLALLALGISPRLAAAPAQNQKKVARIGYVIASRGSAFPKLHNALRSGLRDLGYVDGENIEILVRSADGNADRFPALINDLAQQGLDVVVAANTPAAVAAKTGAPDVPLVFAGVGDPVGSSLVKSLSRPRQV